MPLPLLLAFGVGAGITGALAAGYKPQRTREVGEAVVDKVPVNLKAGRVANVEPNLEKEGGENKALIPAAVDTTVTTQECNSLFGLKYGCTPRTVTTRAINRAGLAVAGVPNNVRRVVETEAKQGANPLNIFDGVNSTGNTALKWGGAALAAAVAFLIFRKA